ncbi:hypothetical protein, partial [Rhizobium johnstonii]|uniref:hypothetical protein n=1 Tax=Rhizobium johnstonii TaxID=3019933 RepID=UPI003F9A6850
NEAALFQRAEEIGLELGNRFRLLVSAPHPWGLGETSLLLICRGAFSTVFIKVHQGIAWEVSLMDVIRTAIGLMSGTSM